MADNGSRVTNIGWAAAGGLAAWAVARLAAADRVRRAEFLAVPLVSLTPQAAAAAPWVALWLRLTRRRGPATLAAVAAAALGLTVRSRRMPSPQPEATGPVLRVLSINMFYGQADTEAIVALVRQTGADLLFLQELTAEAVTRFKQAGLDDLLPCTQLEIRGSAHGARGSGIYGRFPMGEGPALAPTFMAQPTALLELPGGEAVELICAHPVSPAVRRLGGDASRWRDELGALPAPEKLPRVIAGDFNASLDHAVFRQLLRLGYADAAQQTGTALIPTWGLPGKRPLFAIDHVLVDRGCAVRAFSVHDVPRSDHRAVYAEIQLPGR